MFVFVLVIKLDAYAEKIAVVAPLFKTSQSSQGDKQDIITNVLDNSVGIWTAAWLVVGFSKRSSCLSALSFSRPSSSRPAGPVLHVWPYSVHLWPGSYESSRHTVRHLFTSQC